MEKLSIVIPALNEEKRLPSTLDELSGFLDKEIRDYEHEVVIVVPKGTDDTLGVAKKYKDKFSDYNNLLLEICFEIYCS